MCMNEYAHVHVYLHVYVYVYVYVYVHVHVHVYVYVYVHVHVYVYVYVYVYTYAYVYVYVCVCVCVCPFGSILSPTLPPSPLPHRRGPRPSGAPRCSGSSRPAFSSTNCQGVVRLLKVVQLSFRTN